MSKIYWYVPVLICLFLGISNQCATGEEFADPEISYKKGVELQATDLTRSLNYLCEAARQGYGPAQFEVGRIYGNRPGESANADDQRDIAAAMMWLDMAVINDVREAAPLRKALGIRAQPEDFILYGAFTRMEADAPCLWEEIYTPVTEGKGQ
jgi:hypothetical protein